MKYFPYKSDDILVEISLRQNHRPKHILLGNFNIWYESLIKGLMKLLMVMNYLMKYYC